MQTSGEIVFGATKEAVWAALNGPETHNAFPDHFTLSDLDPPQGCTISGDGNVEGSAKLTLEDTEHGSRLSYTVSESRDGQAFAHALDAFLATLPARLATPAAPLYAIPHEDHDHDPTNPHYFGLPIGVIIAGTIAVISVGITLAKFFL